MMLLSLISHLLCAWFALVLPSYATYKALAHGPGPDLLRPLAVYWVVLAVFLAFEQSLGLVLSWLPFYWELRTLFLLYIALPQTQGSVYVYKSFFEPWCARNEADIDAAIVSAQSNAIAFARARIAALVDLISSLLNKDAGKDEDEPSNPPALPVDRLKDLWAAYAPSVFATSAPKIASDIHVSNGQPYSAD